VVLIPVATSHPTLTKQVSSARHNWHSAPQSSDHPLENITVQSHLAILPNGTAIHLGGVLTQNAGIVD
jgi:hypothetical protein